MQMLKDFKEYVSPVLGLYFDDFEIASGKGCYLYDVNGKEYLDFSSGIATCSTGHCHPKIVKAASEQMKKLIHICIGVGLYEPYIKLGQKIREIAPMPDAQIFCCQSGSEAVEAALKLARFASKKPGLIAFEGAFHGRTMGALSLTTSKMKYREGYDPLLPEVYISSLSLPHVEELMKSHQIGGVIIEPIMGEGGYVIIKKEFISGLRKLCDKYGAFLIFDEVQTGVGRTGEWFAANHLGVVPDIITLAKGIASGFPLGVCAAKKEIMAKWPAGAHGSTFGGNPVNCAAAVATIEVIKEKNLVEKSAKLGKYMMKQLKKIQQKYPAIHEVRGIGLMIGVDVESKEKAQAVMKDMRARGIIINVTSEKVIRLVPPLIITKKEANVAMDNLKESLKSAK